MTKFRLAVERATQAEDAARLWSKSSYRIGSNRWQPSLTDTAAPTS